MGGAPRFTKAMRTTKSAASRTDRKRGGLLIYLCGDCKLTQPSLFSSNVYLKAHLPGAPCLNRLPFLTSCAVGKTRFRRRQKLRPIKVRLERIAHAAGVQDPVLRRTGRCRRVRCKSLRAVRLRWIALISWAVFCRFQKTTARVSHFKLIGIFRPDLFVQTRGLSLRLHQSYSMRSPCSDRSRP